MRRLLSLLFLVAAVASAGCGADDFTPEDVAKAAETTLGEETARTDVRIGVSGLGLPQPLAITGTGAMRLDRALWDLTFDLGPAFTMLGLDQAAKSRVLWRDELIHVQVPEIPGFQLPGGKDWVRLDLGRVAQKQGADADALASLLNIDPSTWFAALKRTKKVTEVGDEKIAGVETTHYRGTITNADFIAALPAGKREAAKQALESFGTKAADASTLDLWIDDDDHIRRQEQRVDTPAQQGVPKGKVTFTFTFRDFGVAVDPKAPAASEVYDATEAAATALAGAK